MRFERTRHYYNAACGYREGLRSIWDEFDKRMQELERYKGSAGFEEEKTKAEKKRNAAIEAIQREYRDKFDRIISGMRESATTRIMETPTNEQVNLLQVLRMREKITRDELEQAGRTLKDCPAALSVLDEIAKQHEYNGMHFSSLSTAGILASIDSLADSAKRICALRKCDSKREQIAHASVHSPEWSHDAVYSFRVDCDVSSIGEAMQTFGNVHNLDAFAEAVNE